ncbi:hypothetical protein GUJ93_ZPchr0011g28650 [Zizania palustris]|uniref:Uncharacterized protein n=1 Tax=Zizania palustris TaxID=103762 RepID=A0A8J6BRG2_ZIZPA|nr:hypothetical protein GUJ93_ZPchr0011g28650 [Zizania palustris]
MINCKKTSGFNATQISIQPKKDSFFPIVTTKLTNLSQISSSSISSRSITPTGKLNAEAEQTSKQTEQSHIENLQRDHHLEHPINPTNHAASEYQINAAADPRTRRTSEQARNPAA